MLSVLFGIFASSFGYGQFNSTEFTRLGIDRGLYQASTYSIAQDKTGFMWLASQDGLQLYDGVSFIEFNHNSTTTGGLSSNSVSKVFVDSKNNVLIGTWGGGLNIYNRSSRLFTVFKNDPKDNKSIPHNRVQTLYEDRTGTLWIGTAGGGVCKFNPEDSTFIRFPFGENTLNALSHGRVWAITQAQDGLLWIGTQSGLNTLDPVTGKINRIILKADGKFLDNANLIRTVYTRKNGEIWVGTQNGIYVFSHPFLAPKHVVLPFSGSQNYRVNTINCFYEMDDNSMLIGTYGAGLFYINEQTKQVQCHRYSIKDNASISADDIRCITADNSGLIWIGTRGGSVNTTQMLPKRFLTVGNEFWKDIHLRDKYIRSVLYDSKGNLWIGTNEAGLHLMKKNANFIGAVERKSVDKELFNDRILAINEDAKGTIWFACEDGLYFAKNYGGSIQKYNFPAGSPIPARTESVRQFYITGQQYMWFGTSGFGLQKFDILKKKWSSFTTKQNFPSDEVNYILPGDENNILWLGTNNGFVRFNVLNSSYTVYGSGQGELLRSNPVWALHLHEGFIWMGTSEGLLRFSIAENKLERVREGTDFGSKVISGINMDTNGELWLSTTRGITRYNPYTGDSKSFSIEDGLEWNTYTPGAFSANGTGTVAFGGIHGLTLFNPHKILVNTYRSPVVITGFDVFNESGMLSLLQPGLPPDSSQKIVLSHAQDNFRVSFVTFNFRFSGKNRYFYQLEGVDADWRDAGNANSATYSHIGPGEYVFRVKARNNDMKTMANEASIIIIIQPPFYATLWFRLMLLIAGVAIIAGGYYLRVSNLKKMQIKLETEVEKRTSELQESERSLKQVNATKDKFFSIIAHDLRSPFQALISYSNIINTEFDLLPEEEKKDITAHIEYVARSTYDLLENLLKWSFTQTNKMVINRANIDLFFAVNKVLKTSSQSARIKNITVYMEIPVGLTVYADADMLETIIRNLLGNAIKFTHQGGSVTIKAVESAERVVISITDTGVGMSEARLQELFQMEKSKSTSGTAKEKGSGLGLLLCKEFTEMQSGSLEVISQLNTGTTFTIRLPLSKE